MIIVNIMFLNLTGIVDPTRHHALFQIEFLSDLCKPGAIFDLETTIGMTVPSLIQVIISIVMNIYFKDVAERATCVENHRTQTAHHNSLIIKRFLFNFCDYFLYLFYIGCYELRIDLLRTSLGFLFMVDEVRRVLLETVVPYLQQSAAHKAR